MNLPYQDYWRLDLRKPDRLHHGLDGWAHALAGRLRRGHGQQRKLRKQARRVQNIAADAVGLGDAVLQKHLADSAELWRCGADVRDLETALGWVIEAARRTQGLRAHLEQIMGVLAVSSGHIIEMETGSGKSLTAAMAAVLMGWTNRPCHLITVNDYLAVRDAEAFAPLYAYCSLDVGVVTAEMDEDLRRENYSRAVTYTTSKQLLADFLRDRLLVKEARSGARRLLRRALGMVHPRSSEPVLRGIDQAIIDEADSILIDEAVSPLLIQAEHETRLMDEAVATAVSLYQELESGRDYRLEQTTRRVLFTDRGRARLHSLVTNLPSLWHGQDRREELMRQAIAAHAFYHRNEHYVVQDDKVIIVDQFTGRLMPNRNWGKGLHQAIEVKEGLPQTPAREIRARLSFQRFFRLFRTLGGMSGTAMECAHELWQVYHLPVLAIPSHWPSRRVQWATRTLASAEEKWQAIEDEVCELHAQGRPVLVGTRHIAHSEHLAQRLRSRGLDIELLNALYHMQEAAIVARAGERGRITIATNMAGRGTDIKLARGVSDLGGMHVIVSEIHEAARIDRQLIGRCGRQGDPGTCRIFISREDWLLDQLHPLNKWGVSGQVLKTLAHLSQARAEMRAARARRQVLVQDLRQEDSLLFAEDV